MAYKKNENLVRINTRISKRCNNWLAKRSEESGISKSSLISLAVEQYVNHNEAFENLPELKKAMEKINEIGGGIND